VNKGTIKIGLICSALLVCVLLTSMIVACSNPSSTSTSAPASTSNPAPASTSTPQQAPVVAKEWNLPMLSILTGTIAYAGIPAGWGAQYAVNEINANGGVRGVPIKMPVYDTAFDPAKAVECYSKAIPGSLMVIGPLDGIGAAAGSEQIKEAKITNITDCSEPHQRAMEEPYGISYIQDTGKSLPVCCEKWLELNPYIKSVAIFYMPVQPSSQNTYEQTAAALDAKGLAVVPIEISPTDVDFGPPTLKAINAKADGYIVACLEPVYIGVGKELYNRGITQGTEILGTFACTGPELFTAGKGFLENSYLQENDDPNYSSPEWQKIMAAYAQEYPGQTPPATVCEFYDAVYAFKYCVEALGLTGDPAKLAQEREAVNNWFYNSPEIKGLQFTYKNVNADKIAPVTLLQIKNNAYTLVDWLTLK
jgi:branched-chain amino acid transport system substrate-binding protein